MDPTTFLGAGGRNTAGAAIEMYEVYEILLTKSMPRRRKLD